MTKSRQFEILVFVISSTIVLSVILLSWSRFPSYPIESLIPPRFVQSPDSIEVLILIVICSLAVCWLASRWLSVFFQMHPYLNGAGLVILAFELFYAGIIRSLSPFFPQLELYGIFALIGGLLSGLAKFCSEQMEIGLTLAPIWALIFVVIALILYRLRCQSKTIYGFFEVVVGFITTTLAAKWLPKPIKDFSFSEILDLRTLSQILKNTDLVISLQILGGIYIIIRGLDNIEKGFEGKKDPSFINSSKWRHWIWVRLFHKPLSYFFMRPIRTQSPQVIVDGRSARKES